MFEKSGVENLMSQHFNEYCVFGDQGYTTSGHLISPYCGMRIKRSISSAHRLFATGYVLTDGELAFNHGMLLPRVTVEWCFMLVTQRWQGLQRKQFLRVRNGLVSDMYKCCVLLTNLRTCLDGRNIVSDYFQCDPPTVSEYLNKVD